MAIKEVKVKASETLLLEHDDDSLDISYITNKKGSGILTMTVYERLAGGFGQSARIHLEEDNALRLYEFFKKIFNN